MIILLTLLTFVLPAQRIQIPAEWSAKAPSFKVAGNIYVRDNGRDRLVVFAGSTSVNPGAKLVNNAIYPTIADDYARSFTVCESLKPDVFLAPHASAMGGLSKAGKAGYAEYSAYLARSRRAFEEELARQKGH